MVSKGSGKSHTIHEIHFQLEQNDPEFLSSLFSDNMFCFDLLRISDADVPMGLVRTILNCYDVHDEVFICNDLRLFITLEALYS